MVRRIERVDPLSDRVAARAKRESRDQPILDDLGDQVGILFADLSGWSQLLYQCVADSERLNRAAKAIQRLFRDPTEGFDNVIVESYLGDGFLALGLDPKPVRTLYDLTVMMRDRFEQQTRSLLMDLGFRVSMSFRVGLHVGKVWQITFDQSNGPAHRSSISDAINVASRVVTSQTCRRFGLAVTRAAYRRLMLSGKETIREPDEVLQDRNKYPEPIEIYRLREEEHQKIRAP